MSRVATTDEGSTSRTWYAPVLSALVLIAAMGGGYLGGMHAPPERTVLSVEPSLVPCDAEATLKAIEGLRADIVRLVGRERQPSLSPSQSGSSIARKLVGSGAQLKSEGVPALAAELRAIVERGYTTAEPPPVSILKTAREKDLAAVQEVCLSSRKVTTSELLYQPYYTLLDRFGRPDGIDEMGRLFWNTDWVASPRRVAATVREELVVNFEWVRKGQ